ncbi:hypothetical protein D3C73_278530 [compost metagenome]
MKNKETKRYVLEKLIKSDKKTRLEVWKKTGISSDDPEALRNFVTSVYRIFDTHTNEAL